MKKLLLIPIMFISLALTSYAQKKNYVSFGTGITMTNIHNKMADQLIADGIGDKVVYDPIWFFFYFPGQVIDYPKTHVKRGNNNRFRYGRHIKGRVSIEGGFGRTYSSTVQGADNNGSNINFVNLSTNVSTIYMAYMWNNKKTNAAVGLGPVVSLAKIKHSEMVYDEVLQSKSYVLPGLIFTGYWNFVNQKSWFMGLRNDLSITTPAKTKTFTITNEIDKSFVTASGSNKVGSVINTVTLNAGIKF